MAKMPEQEVLERAFQGRHAALGERGQDVGGQRRQLDADEDHDHVAGRGGEQGPEHGEGEQRVELAERHPAFEVLDVAGRDQHRQDRRRQDHQAQEYGQAVGPEQAVEGGFILPFWSKSSSAPRP